MTHSISIHIDIHHIHAGFGFSDWAYLACVKDFLNKGYKCWSGFFLMTWMSQLSWHPWGLLCSGLLELWPSEFLWPYIVFIPKPCCTETPGKESSAGGNRKINLICLNRADLCHPVRNGDGPHSKAPRRRHDYWRTNRQNGVWPHLRPSHQGSPCVPPTHVVSGFDGAWESCKPLDQLWLQALASSSLSGRDVQSCIQPFTASPYFLLFPLLLWCAPMHPTHVPLLLHDLASQPTGSLGGV